jgi:drug/metabolite transporter (DMT)-like permease
MKTGILILRVVIATSLGDVLIASGLRRQGEITNWKLRDIILFGRKLLVSLPFLGGVFFMAVSFIAFMIVLSWADLSLVVPATSISYVITTFGAKLYLKEEISRLRWAGTAFVCLGVALISLP